MRQLKAFKWNVLLLKIFVVWENMFQFDLLDPPHILGFFSSGFLSSRTEKRPEVLPRTLLLRLWNSLPSVKADYFVSSGYA